MLQVEVEEEVVAVDVVWDGEAAEEQEEVVEVDPGAEEERLGVVVVGAEDSMVLQEEEERVQVMEAESDLEHRQYRLDHVDSFCTYTIMNA